MFVVVADIIKRRKSGRFTRHPKAAVATMRRVFREFCAGTPVDALFPNGAVHRAIFSRPGPRMRKGGS